MTPTKAFQSFIKSEACSGDKVTITIRTGEHDRTKYISIPIARNLCIQKRFVYGSIHDIPLGGSVTKSSVNSQSNMGER